MKKQVLLILSFCFLSVCFSSCQKDDDSLQTTNKKLPEALTKLVSEKIANQSMQRDGNGIRFDYSNITETYNDNKGIQIFTANQFGFSSTNTINYGECYFIENGKVKDDLIIGTETVSNDVKIVHYFEEDWNEFLDLQITISTKSVSTVFSAARNKNCTGANVMGCIQAAYTENGWASVAAWVVSAFYPQCAAAIAVSCAIHNGC